VVLLHSEAILPRNTRPKFLGKAESSRQAVSLLQVLQQEQTPQAAIIVKMGKRGRK
jgi:3-dehydroquinate dehydratase